MLTRDEIAELVEHVNKNCEGLLDRIDEMRGEAQDWLADARARVARILETLDGLEKRADGVEEYRLRKIETLCGELVPDAELRDAEKK